MSSPSTYSALLPIHIVGGSLSIIAGFVALYAHKGSRLHRKSGMAFVIAMFTMCVSAVAIAVFARPNGGNVLQATSTFYMVATALLTVRRQSAISRRVDIAALAFVTLVIIGYGVFALRTYTSPTGRIGGYTTSMFIIFGSIAVLAAMGDIRMLTAGGIHGASRIARHLWRMGYAMFVATTSFFLGQGNKFLPEPLRLIPLRMMPVLIVVALTLYWFVRTIMKRRSARPDAALVLRTQS
jgi:uncharacterized membrane protein